MGQHGRTLQKIFALLLIAASVFAGALADGIVYTENEWNFVDASMDVSGGIPEDAAGALLRIRESGVLRVATEPYYPPQEFIDPALTDQAAYVGADMELARFIADQMGVTLEIVPMALSQVLPAVADGTCDLAISALAFVPARADLVELSKGYYFAEGDPGSGILIREGDRDVIQGVADLADRVIGAQSSSLQETLTAEHVLQYKEFQRFSSVQEVYAALQKGQVDAATVDIGPAQAYIQNNPGCGLMLVDGVSFALDAQFKGDRIAGRKGDLALMYYINGVLDLVLAQDLYTQWIGQAELRAAELGL